MPATAASGAYKPIEDYGVIGDLHTIALVGTDGSIDWCCLPHFDSPSIFAAILDARRGGFFRIAPTIPGRSRQMYSPDTNVLITRFLEPDGAGEVTDFMPIPGEGSLGGLARHQIIRRVACVRGAVPFRLECRPSFNYARDRHTVERADGRALFRAPGIGVDLVSPVPLRVDDGGVTAEWTLRAGETTTFFLRHLGDTDSRCRFSEAESRAVLEETIRYWHSWLSLCQYRGRWREMVYRSALTLKLLTFHPSGAIVAAPTMGLPEEIGGERNWDYRYAWIRDASFTLYALLRVGFTEEAKRFMRWLEARCGELEPDGSLQIVYGLDGRHQLDEEVLGHLEGYRGSRPVRLGNAAYRQLQLDIYGELLDSVYLYNKYGEEISYDLWTNVRRLVDWLCAHWRQPDEGIWEVRGGRQHFVYSKLMAWVAVDRGLRLAAKRSFPVDRARWEAVRDEIYEEIMRLGWSDTRRAFVQHYGSDTLDASILLMPLVKFMGPRDPRMLATLDRTLEELVSDSLVYRYRECRGAASDGIEGDEGTFSVCTFWLVECLTRAGRLEEARLIFEKMLSYANHVGLYAEEVGASGEALGNFPQAFTHFSLISAAFNLDRTLGAGT